LEIVAQHLHVAADRQLLERKQRLHALRLHARAADAGEMRLRQPRAQRLDEMGPELVAGGLARDHAYGERRRGHVPWLPDDAARGNGEEIERGLDVGALLRLPRELALRMIQGVPRAVKRFVSALE